MVIVQKRLWVKNKKESPPSEFTLVNKNSFAVHVYSQHKIIQVGVNKYEH